jgi:hypothetical protein
MGQEISRSIGALQLSVAGPLINGRSGAYLLDAGNLSHRLAFNSTSSVPRTVPKESVMRAVKFLLAASGFLTYFIGMIGLSALMTGAVHSAFYPRAVPMSVIQD